MLGLAGAALGVAALFPIDSLGPSPGDTLAHTSWRAGSRVVTQDNTPVKLGDLEVNGILTVFPEGATGDADSQTILINIGTASQKVPSGRESWSVDGYVAYSKVCTHAGCPVGLYRSTSHQLLCPCHQSTFDVLDACQPVFGPATTPLPQLALTVGDDNVLQAQHDYTQPVGPGYWNRP
jgi:ubiquinol-cytochrome c reductase iron-sulfur subunit